MTIDKETRAEILRLYHVEKWTVGTITRQLGVHRYTVERLLTAAGEPRDARSPRPSMIDPYVPFIAETLASWPGSNGTRRRSSDHQRTVHGRGRQRAGSSSEPWPGWDATGEGQGTSRRASKAPRRGWRSPVSNCSFEESQGLENIRFLFESDAKNRSWTMDLRSK